MKCSIQAVVRFLLLSCLLLVWLWIPQIQTTHAQSNYCYSASGSVNFTTKTMTVVGSGCPSSAVIMVYPFIEPEGESPWMQEFTTTSDSSGNFSITIPGLIYEGVYQVIITDDDGVELIDAINVAFQDPATPPADPDPDPDPDPGGQCSSFIVVPNEGSTTDVFQFRGVNCPTEPLKSYRIFLDQPDGTRTSLSVESMQVSSYGNFTKDAGGFNQLGVYSAQLVTEGYFDPISGSITFSITEEESIQCGDIVQYDQVTACPEECPAMPETVDTWRCTIPSVSPTPPALGEDFSYCNQVPSGAQRDACNACVGSGPADSKMIFTALGCIRVDQEGMAQDLITLLLGISGGIALLSILGAAFLLAISQGDSNKVKQAKELITAAVMGLLFLIFSIFILEFIGITILRIPGLS